MIPAFTAANLFAWSLQVAVIVLLGGCAVYLARLQSPRVRLACFRALLVACLALPFVQPIGSGPAQVLGLKPGAVNVDAARTAGPELPAVSVDVTPANASRAGESPGGRFAWVPAWALPAVVLILALGVVARFTWLLVGLLALRRLRREAVAAGQDFSPAFARAADLAGASADILTSSAVTHPVTFGLRRPLVLLPDSYASLDEVEQVAVVCHELLHVGRRDWLHTVSEELFRAVLWFHPAIWWLLAHIDLSREQLVDQEVVALTERRQPYVNALVTLALTPAGPILRPASLFLGRAHLIQRVALLSREVRMSRPRLVLSLAVIMAALVVGGQFAVHAFPLTAAARSAVAMTADSTTATARPAPAPVRSGGAFAAGASLVRQGRTHAEVLLRAEPIVPGQPEPGTDVIVAMQVAVQPAGDAVVSGPVEMFAGVPGKRSFEARASDGEAFQRMFDQNFGRVTGTSFSAATNARAAFDALRAWRFTAIEQPFTTVIGFNLARGDQSGPEATPVRIGGGIPAPVRIRNVQPVYPLDAQTRGIQGVVILEVTIDGAGIPINAYALRPIEGLTLAAVQAALQWRYVPDATYSRRLMTLTVNFTLGGVTGGIVAGSPTNPPPPPPAPDVVGGVRGGVQGGVVGGVASGVQGGVVGGVVSGVQGGVAGGGVLGGIFGQDSFGPSRAEWPSNAIRVGGNIKAPTRTVNVLPVYPADALTAKVQGVVIVEVLIGPDGSVQAGQVLRSIPMLDRAALDAVRQWQYTPTLLNGNPVPVIMTVTANFTLQ